MRRGSPARAASTSPRSAPTRSSPIRARAWLTPRKNRVLANVTDMGVLIKAGTASGLVWVTSLSTGAPVEGAKVTVFTPQGKQVWSGTTDDGRPREAPRDSAC